jgi:predicted dehydrogenase
MTTVRAVLVGCGAMSKAWLDAARQIDGLEIAGLVDIDASRAEGRAAEFGLADAVTGSNVETVLDAVKPDVVFDVTVPDARAVVAFAALERGCHLLTEKPLARSVEEGRAIIVAAEDAGRLHAVVQNRRYLSAVRRIRRLIDSGAIGRPTQLNCDFFLAPHFGGFREEMDHVLLLDMAIHTFDAVRAMTGLEATRVYCREWNPPGSWYRRDASAVAIFDMEGGAVFTYRGSWCAEGLRTSWEGSWRIVGERGTLIWDGGDGLRAEVTAGERDGLFDRVAAVEIPAADDSDAVGGHLGVMRDFVDAMRGGKRPETVGSDNIKSLAMVLGAIRSAEMKRPVEISTQEQSA